MTGSVLIGQVNVQWESRYTSAGSNLDQASDMVIDASGNIYVTGTSYNGAGTGFDLVTVMYDNAGTELWTASLDGPSNGYDVANAITIDASGNVYIVGTVQAGATDYDIVTAMYNNSGALQWDRYYDQSGRYDEGNDIVVDGSGNVYVTGNFQASASNTNYGTIKYNSAGTQQWAVPYNSAGTDVDQALKIALDPIGGGVVVTGNSDNGADEFDFLTIWYNSAGTVIAGPVSYDHNSEFDTPADMVVDAAGNVHITGFSYHTALQDLNYSTVKYNSSGVQQWAMNYNGTGSDTDKPNAITVDGSGNVVVTGRSVGSATAENYLTILYDAAGTEMWTKTYTSPSTNFDEATDVVIGPSGDIYVTGYSYLAGQGNDFVTVRYDISGNEIWAVRFDGPASGDDKSLAMGVDPAGNIYVTGTSVGSGTFNDYSTIKYCQLLTDAGPDLAICTGDTVTLTATGGPTDVQWSPAGTLSNPTGYTTQAYPTSTQEYVVYTDNATGCRDYDTVTVVVNPLPGPAITPLGPTTFCIGDSVTLVSDSWPSYQWNTGPNDTLQTITAFTTGTYTVTVVDTMGCNNSTSINVTANALPMADAGINDSICMGDSIQLLATGGVSYVWDPNPQLSSTSVADPWVYPTDTAWYVVTVTDANSCVNVDSVEILAWPLPAQPIVSQVGFDLISTPACSATDYQWYLNGFALPGANSQTYDALLTGNGDYFVEIWDCNGCSSISDTTSITTISVNELPGFANMNLFPNPNDGSFTLELAGSRAADAVFMIRDITGALIYEEQLTGISGNTQQTFQLDVAPGVYTIMLTSDQGNVASRMVIR